MPDTQLVKAHVAASKTDDFSVHRAFLDLLLARGDLEAIQWHYDLLRDRSNRDLYLRLRHSFAQRGKEAADFLARQLRVEQDRDMRLDLLHLLGRMRHPSGLAAARASVTYDDAEFRERALYVLGWMGYAEDIDKLIRPRLLGDPNVSVRRNAATALSQITDRLARAKPRAIRLLFEALQQEQNLEVIKWIVVTAQYVTGKRFGLKEDIEEAEVLGDVPSAREKCLASLGRLVQ